LELNIALSKNDGFLALSSAIAAGLLKSGMAIPQLGVESDFTVFGAIVAGLLASAT
jgi:hypothetical protein